MEGCLESFTCQTCTRTRVVATEATTSLGTTLPDAVEVRHERSIAREFPYISMGIDGTNIYRNNFYRSSIS